MAELKLSDNIQEKVKDIFTSLDTAQVNQLSDRITVTLSQVKDANSFKVEDTIDAIFLIGLTLKDANDKLEKETILLTVGISPPQKPHDTPTCTCVHHSSSKNSRNLIDDKISRLYIHLRLRSIRYDNRLRRLSGATGPIERSK